MSYLSKREALKRIQSGGWNALPLELTVNKVGKDLGNFAYDWLLELQWEGVQEEFAVKYKRRSTPKQLQQAVQTVKRLNQNENSFNPMVVVPYLEDEKLDFLENEKVSGLDLCGNAVIMVPGKMYVRESGNPNQFTETAAIKNVFQGKSSLVVRTLLVEPVFSSVNAVVRAVEDRCGSISQSTVSRVLKRLSELMLINRKNGEIRVKTLEGLLDKLEQNFTVPRIQGVWKGNIKGMDDLLPAIYQSARATDELVAGISIDQYTVLPSTEDTTSVYVTSIERILDQLKKNDLVFEETAAFPKITLKETKDPKVYFDARESDEFRWCSPIQLYLELKQGDQRKQQAAEQIRNLILNQGRQKLESD
ncbi:MAG: hypothetical protein ACQEP7_02400 [bacterium]